MQLTPGGQRLWQPFKGATAGALVQLRHSLHQRTSVVHIADLRTALQNRSTSFAGARTTGSVGQRATAIGEAKASSAPRTLDKGDEVVQCVWKVGVNGPADFDPDVAVASADWAHPKYVSVNLGGVQPDPPWTSYRITAWAPANVGEWEVTVAAHVYFEANATTNRIRRTQFGHLYVNDWEGFFTEDDGIRATVYARIRDALLAMMPQVMAITAGSSVNVVGAYNRASFRPRRLS